MASGKLAQPKAIGPGGAGFYPKAASLLFAVLATLVMASCADTGEASFAPGLARLDALLAGRQKPDGISRAFDRLYGLARDSTQWLSLAKRSPLAETLGDEGRNGKTADAALRAFPSNEAVAVAAAWLLLRDGKAEKALALFPARLKPELHGDLWAEARLATARPVSDQQECRMLATATGDPSWYIEAALLAMRAGDRFAAQAWLRESIRRGSQAPIPLLWDAGLNGEMLDAIGMSPGAGYSALGADAAWLLGDRAGALALWNEARATEPEPSWQTRVALAVLQPRGDATLASARDLAARYKASPEALRYAAAIFLREGHFNEAAALAPDLERGSQFLPEALGIELESRRQAEGRFVARAIRLSEEHSENPAAREYALRVLLAHGRWDEYLILHDAASTGDRADPGWWFWAMVADVLRGDYAGADAKARDATTGGRVAGSELAFAQGLIASLRKDLVSSESLFRAALDLSIDGKQRARVLKEIGRLEAGAGRRAQALAAFDAAKEADPGDIEAGVLASSLAR